MNEKEYNIGNIVTMKKGHPCGANEWEIIRVGADIKLRCTKCNRIIMMSRIDFNKRLKKIVK
jgi:hypothetical protein